LRVEFCAKIVFFYSVGSGKSLTKFKTDFLVSSYPYSIRYGSQFYKLQAKKDKPVGKKTSSV
jgi:hypothetical protein